MKMTKFLGVVLLIACVIAAYWTLIPLVAPLFGIAPNKH
jgi:hypothetical protein